MARPNGEQAVQEAIRKALKKKVNSAAVLKEMSEAEHKNALMMGRNINHAMERGKSRGSDDYKEIAASIGENTDPKHLRAIVRTAIKKDPKSLKILARVFR